MDSTIDTDRIKQIFKAVKPVFKQKIGTYTHKRISGDWHFKGLAYVRDDMTYVFGFNLGFFKNEGEKNYGKVGMNVLVRTNGISKKLRKQYADFFQNNLQDWYTKKSVYTSFRGGEGLELQRYMELKGVDSDDEIIEFLISSIDGLSLIYKKIEENPENIFDDVLRGAFPWHDTIFDICKLVNTENQ